MEKLLLLAAFTSLVNADNSYYVKGELVELQKMATERSIAVNENSLEYFTTKSGKKLAITDEILTKCKVGIDCMELFSKFNLKNISQISDTIFVIKIEDYNNIFSLSRELYESGDVEFAHPNFIKERRLR